MSQAFEALPELLALIYSAAEDSALWEDVLLAVCRVTEGVGATLVSHDLMSSGSAAWFVGFHPEALQQYNQHYHTVDAWALAASDRKLRASGPVVADEQLIPRQHFLRTEFSAFLARYDIGRMMHATFTLSPQGTTGLSVYRNRAGKAFDREALEVLRVLSPHLQRALRLHDALADVRAAHQDSLDALDALSLGVCLLSSTGRLLHANRAAAALLNMRDGLRVERGELRGLTPEVTNELRRCCVEAARLMPEPSRARGVVLLPRAAGRRPLHAIIGPLTHGQSLARTVATARVVMFISDPEATAAPRTEVLQAIFRFTPAEATVAAAIVDGQELSDVADALGYTKATMQWYSKQVLAKAGVRTRTELARLVLSSVAMLHPVKDA